MESNLPLQAITLPRVSLYRLYRMRYIGTGVNSTVPVALQPATVSSVVYGLFGDTSVVTGNRFDPTHAYTKTGICNLPGIKTKDVSKYCNTVVFTPDQ